MMKWVLIFVFSLLVYNTNGQTNDMGSVRLNILEDTIRVGRNTEMLRLSYELKNLQDLNYIFYNLDRQPSRGAAMRYERYCDLQKNGANIVFMIFDQEQKWVSGKFEIRDDFSKLMTDESADSLLKSAHAETLNKTVVVEANSQRRFEDEIDFGKYSLPIGRYYVQLIYYSGERINIYASKDQQKRDKQKYNAKIYQGCVFSQKVLVIFE